MIKNIKTVNENPNFSVVVPNNCGCKCSFCFDDKDAQCLSMFNWMRGLESVMRELPDKFSRVSVTGGEITNMDVFTISSLLSLLRRRFRTVVVNTNAANLNRSVYALSRADHVNVSYHGTTKFESDNVFGKYISPPVDLLKSCISGLADMGTSIRLQRVVKELDFKQAMFYIEFAKFAGADEACFRMDINQKDGLSGDWIPFNREMAIGSSSCPVCATWDFKIAKMGVIFKAGAHETDNGSLPYELIYRKDGMLSTMWSKFKAPRFERPALRQKIIVKDTVKERIYDDHGRAVGGRCGGDGFRARC
jgi:hypothetical protein